MVKTVIAAFILSALGCAPVCAESEKLGRDDFVSSTISDVFDKVGKYTSGEKRLFDPDEKKAATREAGYDTDPLGRKIPDQAIKPLKRPPASE